MSEQPFETYRWTTVTLFFDRHRRSYCLVWDTLDWDERRGLIREQGNQGVKSEIVKGPQESWSVPQREESQNKVGRRHKCPNGSGRS